MAAKSAASAPRTLATLRLLVICTMPPMMMMPLIAFRDAHEGRAARR